MLESLVEGGPQKYHDLHFLACESIVHHLVTSELVAQLVELGRDALYSVLGLRVLEWGCVAFNTVQRGHL